MLLLIYIVLFLLLALVGGMVFILAFDFINLLRGYSPNLPSNDIFVKNITKIYEFKPGQRVVDLGCGGGKLIATLKDLPITITGVEINPLLYWFCKIRFAKAKNVKIVYGDLLAQNLTGFDVIVIYAVPDVVTKLYEKLISTNVNNLTIISNRFRFDKLPVVAELPNTFLYKIA